MGFRVIGIDVSDPQLELAKELGAEMTYNSLSNPAYAEELKVFTGGGVHAAAVFSASNAAYEKAPSVLRCVPSHQLPGGSPAMSTVLRAGPADSMVL